MRWLALVLLLIPSPALAWGATGHRIVAELAIEQLPPAMPAFLRAPGIGELAREPDRTKGSGKLRDSDLDPAHFIDVDAAGLVMGGPPLAALPETRAEYEAALRAAGTDSWQAGYLYHAMVGGWLALVKDFATWRALSLGEARETDPERRAWYAADRARREALIARDLGQFAHFVGDGAQPLHVTVHFNGWVGDNPNGYTTGKVHTAFEGEFVRANLSAAEVRARMTPPAPCPCSIETRTVRYLQATHATVEPFYALEKADGLTDKRGREFAAERLAAGASELRDQVIAAWNASANATVGWPVLKVADIEAGTVDPYDSLYGLD